MELHIFAATIKVKFLKKKIGKKIAKVVKE